MEGMINMNEVKLTILVDNIADQGLTHEHGFSCWVEVGGRKLLFDTGQGAAFAENAEKLSVDIKEADLIVLSHGHYDHTGGLTVAASKAPGADIYAHPVSTIPRYSIRDGAAKRIGMGQPAREVMNAETDRIQMAMKPIEVIEGVGVTGPIPRNTTYEDTGGPFYLDPDGLHTDPIIDDQAMWIRTTQGLVVVVGCSHAGLVNTLRYALKVSGEERLHAVLGGFHLNRASEERLQRTMAELEKIGFDHIVPCHCTGDAAVQRLRDNFGRRVSQGSAGAVFCF